MPLLAPMMSTVLVAICKEYRDRRQHRAYAQAGPKRYHGRLLWSKAVGLPGFRIVDDDDLAVALAASRHRDRFLDVLDRVCRMNRCGQLAGCHQADDLSEYIFLLLRRGGAEPPGQPETAHGDILENDDRRAEHAGLAAHGAVVDQGRPFDQC